MRTILAFFADHATLYTIVKVVLILLATVVIASIAKSALNKLERKLEQSGKDGGNITGKLLKKALLAVLYILGILAAIRQIPALSGAVTTVLAGSGVLAVVIGFAAQESFGNLVSGVFLTLFKPFNVGDRITLVSEGVTGFVEDITLRHTIIRTALDTRMLIPNSTVGSAIVENTDYVEGVAVKNPIDVDVAYDTDLDYAVRVMGEAISSHPLYTGPSPATVLVTEFGASGISLRGVMCTENAADILGASSEARILVKKAFDAAGIGIPFQTITIANQAPGETIPVHLVSNK